MERNPVKFGECVRDKRLTRIAELTIMNNYGNVERVDGRDLSSSN